METEHPDLCGHNPLLNQAVDLLADEGVVEYVRVGEDCLAKPVLHPLHVLLRQLVAQQEQRRLSPVQSKNVVELLDGRGDQLLQLFVVQLEGLDELIVARPLALQFPGRHLGNAELVPVLQTAPQVVLAALVAVPQLDHGCGQYQIHVAQVHIVSPGILDEVRPRDLLRELQKIEGEHHPLLPGEPGVDPVHHVVQAKIV